MQEIVKKLTSLNKTISIMESCTGGALANEITNIEGASEVFKFGAVTYSNEFKIKMKINANLIDKYSVYSQEVANNMAYTIANFTNSNYAVGITGKLNKVDKYNLYSDNDVVYVSIYDKDLDKYYELKIKLEKKNRLECKQEVINEIIKLLKKIVL